MGLGTRRLVWRAGRKLYMWARADEPNDMKKNGELRLQRLVMGNADPRSKLVAFDVGARVGDWSRAFADRASARPTGFEMHAFEPVPESRRMFSDRLAPEIRTGSVRISGVALSDELSKASIYVPHRLAGTCTLHPEPGRAYEDIVEVETATVDEYCRVNSIEYIDLLKIDTEGNDLRVIRGASRLLRGGKIGVLQFEYNHRWIYSRSYLKDVFDLLVGGPYHLAKICAEALEVYARWHPELERYFETNYALIRADLLQPLNCRVLRIGTANVCERVDAGADFCAGSFPG